MYTTCNKISELRVLPIHSCQHNRDYFSNNHWLINVYNGRDVLCEVRTESVLYCIVVGIRRLLPPDALQLIVQALVFSRSYLHRQVSPPETLVVKGGTTWARNGPWIFFLKMSDFHVTFRDLLHAVNLRHGENGFTSLPKGGVLRIFSPRKIRRLRPGLSTRTWVPKASTLPLDHRSR